MATLKEATVIIFDIGQNTKTVHDSSEKSFFDQAKSCIDKILQRKIFSQPKDEVGLILMGTNGTQNQLNVELGGYEHISEAFDLEMTNWKMLQIVEKEIQQNNCEADWLDAIVVALNVFNKHKAKKFKTFKIVLLTTFTTDTDSDNFDVVVEQLNSMAVELIVIAQNVEYIPTEDDDSEEIEDAAQFSQTMNKTQCQQSSESLITQMILKTNGVLCDFGQALVQLIYFEKKKQRTMPWSTELQIGSKLKIKVSAYIQVKDTPMETWKTDSGEGYCRLKTEYFLDDKEMPEEKVEELIRGYMYGDGTPVAYDSSLGMSFDGGQKSLQCIGFTNQELIRDRYLAGTGSWSVVSHKGFSTSEKMLVALVSAMKQSQMALIARYVYRAGTKPKIMALFTTNSTIPYKSDASLTMMELLFTDNHVELPIPPLKSKKSAPTEEQLSAVDSLIDSLNLMDAFDNENNNKIEAFVHKKLLNPTLQYTYRVITNRALNPMQALPKPDDDLLDMLAIPKKLKTQSAQPISDIKKLFPLERVVRPANEQLFAKLQEISSSLLPPSDDNAANNSLITPTANATNELTNDDNLVVIGTVTPAEDFAELLRRGEKYATLCQQIQVIIKDLVFKSIMVQIEKVAMAIMIYREEAKLLGAFRFNEWIEEFKKLLLDGGKLDIWTNIIVEHRFGLIGQNESETSTVTDEQIMAFYSTDKSGLADGATGIDNANDEDIDELFGNM